MLRMGSPLTLTAWRNKTEGEFKGQRAKDKLLSCSATATNNNKTTTNNNNNKKQKKTTTNKTHFFQTAVQEVIVFVHKPCMEINITATHTLGEKGLNLKYSQEGVKLDVPVMV